MGELKLSAAIVFVRDLERSVDFYREVLGLEAEIVAVDAAVLFAPGGDHVALRALPNAQRTIGNVGVQYLVWTARDADHLSAYEEALRARKAFVSTTNDQGVTVVEGHDPDNIPVLLVYPASSRAGLTAVPLRAYGY